MGDFLSNFESDSEKESKEKKNKVPDQDAFSEEEFVFDKEYARNKLLKRGLAVLIAVLVFIGSFMIYDSATTTKMKDFVGHEYTNMAEFVNKYSLVVIKRDEFSDTIEENVIISQDIKENTKIKKGSTIIITVSAGPDPDEVIIVPNFKEMTHSEIIKWKEDNKLSNVTVRTQYDDEVESGGFLNATFIEGSEEHFKRKNRLTIYTSKGAEPISNEVAVIDFTNQTKDQIIAWGSKNDVVIEFKQVFSDSVPKDMAVRQSVESGTVVDKGSKIVIDVSAGPSVTVTDFSKMDKNQAISWGHENGITIIVEEVYLDGYAKGGFVSQSVYKNKVVSNTTSIVVKYALGEPYIESYVSMSKYQLLDFIDGLNRQGTNISVVEKFEYSSLVPKHSIIFQSKSNVKIGLDAEITVVVSRGERYVVENVLVKTVDSVEVPMNEEEARESSLCAQMSCVFEYIDDDSELPSGAVVSQSIDAGEVVGLPEMITIYIKK